MDAADRIKAIYGAAVAAVEPRTCVRQELEGGLPDSFGERSIYVIALGKAAAAMAAGAVDALSDRIGGGVVVTKEATREQLQRFRYLLGSHPVPDEKSLEAGAAILEFVNDLPGEAAVLCLISGGGSALVESLREPFDLDDLRSTTTQLLRAGAPIEELNAVRSRMSRIKGGGLLAAIGNRPVMNLIISDVLGDNLQAIASGPSVARVATSSADEVARRYGLDITFSHYHEPDGQRETDTRIVANLPGAIEAAAVKAAELGLRPVVLTDRLEGEAREAGRIIAQLLAGSGLERSPLRSGDCVLLGGETTVTVRGDGVGGRNTEAALAAALQLRGTCGITAGFLATDGDDGMTDAAGAIVDGATISPDDENAARKALADNDSYGFLSGVGAVWTPGPSGTNVNDLVIAIIE